ncbi:hypothetical protein [Nonomuraea salmonea]|uniref:hypothetical protein n=1 Tax=Nonomuraea salmonea TaxID=46181 RepID=UPI0031EEF84A
MIKAEQDHKSNDSQSVRALTSGCVGSIGGALIRDLLDAEVTVRRGYTFQVTDDSVAVSNVSIGMVMGLEVRAVLKAPALDDLIRIEFEWEGRAIIQRLELNGILESKVWIKATVKAAVTVGLLFLRRRVRARNRVSGIRSHDRRSRTCRCARIWDATALGGHRASSGRQTHTSRLSAALGTCAAQRALSRATAR